MNPPTARGGGGPLDPGDAGSQTQDPKRRIGQHGAAGEPPIMKK